MNKLSDHKIYLASKSPRRRELLHQIGVQFELLLLHSSKDRPEDVPEIVLPNELPQDYVTRITHQKAETAWHIMQLRKLPLRPVLAADTAVVLDGVIYGKPANPEEARMMLMHFSGRTHQVLTSVTVLCEKHRRECTQISEVTFCTLNQNQIDHYCNTQEPYDKAGGYAVQGQAAQFITHISGSYSSIMGLPLFETTQLLSEVGVTLL